MSAERQRIALREVGQAVLDKISIPKDRWEIAAQLEVIGLRDSDAPQDYGEKDIFSMASTIYGLYQSGELKGEVLNEPLPKAPSAVLQFLRSYLDGLVFALPMALQLMTMMVWGVTLWGAVELDLRTGSAVALGFFGSYAVTGGFSQAIVRRGLFYFFQDENYLARRVVLQMWTLAVAVAVGVLAVALLINLGLHYLPWDMLAIASVYYLTLSVLWLNFALLYLVRRNSLFTFLVAVGLLIVIFLRREAFWTVVSSNAVALVILDVLSFLLAFWTLSSRARERGVTKVATPPRLTILVYSVSLYFVYGLLYQMMLFGDRLIAWTGVRGRGEFLPYVFWFDPQYELGMAMSLMVVVLLMGMVEHTCQRFSLRLVPEQKGTPASRSATFNGSFQRFYRGQMIAFAAAAVVAVLGTYAMVVILSQVPVFAILNRMFAPIPHRVFWVGSISYAFFMAALLNVLILLSLSRVNLAVRALLISVICNLIVGFLCSRMIHYAASVAGLLVGAIVFAVYSTVTVRRVLSRLDYYYYSAY